jgi:hypothetical protein
MTSILAESSCPASEAASRRQDNSKKPKLIDARHSLFYNDLLEGNVDFIATGIQAKEMNSHNLWSWQVFNRIFKGTRTKLEDDPQNFGDVMPDPCYTEPLVYSSIGNLYQLCDLVT